MSAPQPPLCTNAVCSSTVAKRRPAMRGHWNSPPVTASKAATVRAARGLSWSSFFRSGWASLQARESSR